MKSSATILMLLINFVYFLATVIWVHYGSYNVKIDLHISNIIMLLWSLVIGFNIGGNDE